MKLNSKSLSCKNFLRTSMSIERKNKMEAFNCVNYSTLAPYCKQNLKGGIFDFLPPVNTENTEILVTTSIDKTLIHITKSLFPNFKISSPIAILYRVVSLIKNYRFIALKNFSFCNSCASSHVMDYLTDTEKTVMSSIVFMDNTPKGPGDTGGVKDGSDSENVGEHPNPKSDSTKDLSKTKSDSGHESAGSSSPSGSKPSTPSQSLTESLSSEEFPNFPEEIVWEPLPDDVELGFEEEMSESNREKDERWYPHLKPPTSQTQVKYFPKIYYEEITTYEPSRATPPPQPAQRQGPPRQFKIYEDPEEESRHWPQVSFNTPPSPIPTEGPLQSNHLHRLNTSPPLADRSPDSFGRTVRVRRQIEYVPEESNQPLTSTPDFRPQFSSTMAATRRNLFSEFDSPSHNREASLVRNSDRPRNSSPGTPPRSSPFSFSPEPIRPTSRKQGDPFVYSDEEDAGPSWRPPRFILSPETNAKTQRGLGDRFTASNEESNGPSNRPRFSVSPEVVTTRPDRKLGESFIVSNGEEHNPREVTHIHESMTTCDERNCIEEVRETTVRKRVFPNDGSLPVGQPIVKTKVTKSIPVPEDNGDENTRGHLRGNLSASSSKCINCGCPSGPQKKTSITNSPLTQNLKADLKSTLIEDTKSLYSSLVSGNFISNQFETISNRKETIVDQLNRDKSTWTMVNLYPYYYVRMKDRLLGCNFANYKATYSLRIGFLDL